MNQVPNEQFNELIILCDAVREDDDLYRRSCGDFFIKEVKRREQESQKTTYPKKKKHLNSQNININKDFGLKIQIKDKENNPIANRKYRVIYLSGEKEESITDENGYVYIKTNSDDKVNIVEVMMNSPKGNLDIKKIIKFDN
ncbi:hypothetical protein HYE60_02805 [Aggregatibacter actinomycetemcomitans]|uniref:hypothetical protein n=1 Tax=Aggregatibacter actinomycetemcomitans TaxID=714 RepID=UPI00197B81B2|nr:hypothetical protein [Aggregatibacter actinomycetemcomitans]MBN6074196.1 hypothetical protein [Aggregatibacter actinomycetemcomitans]